MYPLLKPPLIGCYVMKNTVQDKTSSGYVVCAVRRHVTHFLIIYGHFALVLELLVYIFFLFRFHFVPPPPPTRRHTHTYNSLPGITKCFESVQFPCLCLMKEFSVNYSVVVESLCG